LRCIAASSRQSIGDSIEAVIGKRHQVLERRGMYKFKSSLFGLLGVLTLVAIVTVAMPHRGAGSTGGSAPTSQTQNVNVVNTPTVSAQQSGSWNVGINGTPTVTVSNFPATNNVGIDPAANTVKIDATNPLPVRDVDNPARHPFAASCTINNNGGFPCTLTMVPPGKRLVIEMFQLTANGGELYVTVANTPIKYTFLQSTQLVRVYADPLTTVQAAGGAAGTVVTITGYLVDLP